MHQKVSKMPIIIDSLAFNQYKMPKEIAAGDIIIIIGRQMFILSNLSIIGPNCLLK